MVDALICLLGCQPPFRLLVLALVLTACLAGCATTNGDSDLPWNMQQPWESAPSIPGFSPR